MGSASANQRGLPSPSLRFRGMTLGSHALGTIRRIIRECDGLSRTHICQRVCRYFGWHSASGSLAVPSAMGLLVRLERMGLVQLPAARTRHRGPRRPRPIIAEATVRFELPLEAGSRVIVRPLRKCELDAYRALFDQHHYLGWRQPPGNVLAQVAFFQGDVVALLLWATATLHNSSRDEWIGWDASARTSNLRFVATNVRFLMLPAEGGVTTTRPPNLASRVLAASLARLSAQWEAMHGLPLLLAETFVDPSRFRGTCYRASNWIYVGKTSGWSRSGKVYTFHGNPKSVFVFPLKRRSREWLRSIDNPLNGAKRVHLDPTRLPLEGEDGLLDLARLIKDPRKKRGVRHKAAATFAMILTGVLAGLKSIAGLTQWVHDLPDEFIKQLGASRFNKPSYATIRRFLMNVDADELDKKLSEWTARRIGKGFAGEGIALDGKTLRGSQEGAKRKVHLVSAVLHANGEVLAQTQVPEKTNEIKAVEPTLSDLNIKGAIVTGDAMFTQTEIAKYLVEEKEANYVLDVKDNQLNLRNAIECMHLEQSFFPSAYRNNPRTRSNRSPQNLG